MIDGESSKAELFSKTSSGDMTNNIKVIQNCFTLKTHTVFVCSDGSAGDRTEMRGQNTVNL